MTPALQNYQARMQRVLDHIEHNLDGTLDLDAISRVAAFSRFHFHRQFAATFDLSLHRYVQLARMKRAAHQLTANASMPVTEIALEAGYDAPDAFARAFRQRFGQSPSAFRQSPDWDAWIAAFVSFDNARNKLMQIVFEPGDVMIRDVAATPVAMIEHRGSRADIPQTREKFIAWRKASGLSPETNPTYMVFRSEREPQDRDAYSMDLCMALEMPLAGEDGPVKPGEIPGGRCAVLRYPGNTNNLEPAALYLYRDWLPGSGEEVRDFPMYSKRWIEPIPGVAAHEVVVEVFLPLK